MTTDIKIEAASSYPVIHGAPEGQDARILADMARDLMPQDRVLIHVALDDGRMHELEELLHFFAPDISVLKFPAWDCLPYDRVSPNNEIVGERVAALTQMMIWEGEARRYPRVVLTSVNALIQKVMPKSVLEQASFTAQKGGRVNVEALQDFLGHNGYCRTDTVREPGEYAIRGGIIDVFPAGYENPVRLDLFGDEVESIKEFDAAAQTSIGSLKEFSLQPATEFFLNPPSISRFRQKYLELFGVVRGDDPLYEAVSAARRYNGMDHWLPLFYDSLDTLFDYVPARHLTFDHHAISAYEERLSQIYDFYEARKTLQQAAKKGGKADKTMSGAIYNPVPVGSLFIEKDEFEAVGDGAEVLSPFGGPDEAKIYAKKARDFSDIRAQPDGDVFQALKTYLHGKNAPVLIAAYSEGSMSRLKSLLEEQGFKGLKTLTNWKDGGKKLAAREIALCVLALEHGFDAPDLVVLSEADILGDRLTRKAAKKKKADNFLKEVSALKEGDLVVHIDHGVGKFIALETLQAGGTLHDCLKIEYAGGDKLYAPVENLEVLSRFGGDEGTVQLDRLGGAGWQARKARVKKDLMAMADHLLQIAAGRKLQKADKLDVSETEYNKFAARFPYNETEDQDRAIKDALADMAGDYPMDRLVCGDVGFGKTEVALRAAYVAAMSGVQVAVVVPTTLLARQHYKNFMERFKGLGLRVEQLSRLVAAKDAKLIKQGIEDGEVNIVIGTHALFAKSLKFANLGLMILDEEQRFGVKQKEKLKELKNNIHVLTLSATPIPRTLQMSLTGVKDLSLITTPPVDRLAIRSFVMPFDSLVIREAILREHYRGGQTFYVCPRVKEMDELEAMLKDLVPEVKVITAHGQMTPTELEDRMNAFYDGQYQVLLATNIIESGIDIPTANTMIVHRADMFGLAQLYQIRGRIGRSKVRAYAYLTYPANEKLNEQAMKRLEVMETLDTLGSGFQLASHDMDIRGAGNLLGEQQSGHIREVGVELYQQMLEEAVAAAKEGASLEQIQEENWSPQINLGISILIPETYVEDLNVRMSLYRRLQDLKDKSDVESFAAELIDRFGELPEEVENLLSIVVIKQLCRQAGVGSVDAGPKGCVLSFHNDAPPNVVGLMQWMGTKAGTAKIRPDQKISIIRNWEKPVHRLKGVQTILKELASLA